METSIRVAKIMMMLLERGNKRWEGWSCILLVSIIKKNTLHADYRKMKLQKSEYDNKKVPISHLPKDYYKSISAFSLSLCAFYIIGV